MTQATFDMMNDLPDRIEKLIVNEECQLMPGSRVLICVLTTVNGSAFVGSSVTSETTPMDYSVTVAREMAKNKLVQFENYLTAQRIYEGHPGVAWASDKHASDCATHNEPAYPNGECDCEEGTEAGN